MFGKDELHGEEEETYQVLEVEPSQSFSEGRRKEFEGRNGEAKILNF